MAQGEKKEFGMESYGNEDAYRGCPFCERRWAGRRSENASQRQAAKPKARDPKRWRRLLISR